MTNEELVNKIRTVVGEETNPLRIAEILEGEDFAEKINMMTKEDLEECYIIFSAEEDELSGIVDRAWQKAHREDIEAEREAKSRTRL